MEFFAIQCKFSVDDLCLLRKRLSWNQSIIYMYNTCTLFWSFWGTHKPFKLLLITIFFYKISIFSVILNFSVKLFYIFFCKFYDLYKVFHLIHHIIRQSLQVFFLIRVDLYWVLLQTTLRRDTRHQKMSEKWKSGCHFERQFNIDILNINLLGGKRCEIVFA